MIEGVRLETITSRFDDRGSFTKIFSKQLGDFALQFDMKEIYYSISEPNVIRGFHYQAAPHDGFKIVHLVYGAVHDVLLDVREGSKTFGEIQKYELSEENPSFLIIPPGVAHAFQARRNSMLLYVTSNDYDLHSDTGFNPIETYRNWPLAMGAVSQRDLELPNFVHQGGVR